MEWLLSLYLSIIVIAVISNAQRMTIFAKYKHYPPFSLEISTNATILVLANEILSQPITDALSISGITGNELIINYAGQDLLDYAQQISDIGICAESTVEFRPYPGVSTIDIFVKRKYEGPAEGNHLYSYNNYEDIPIREIPIGHPNFLSEIRNQAGDYLRAKYVASSINIDAMPFMFIFAGMTRSTADFYRISTYNLSTNDLLIGSELYDFGHQRLYQQYPHEILMAKPIPELDAHFVSNNWLLDANGGKTHYPQLWRSTTNVTEKRVKLHATRMGTRIGKFDEDITLHQLSSLIPFDHRDTICIQSHDFDRFGPEWIGVTIYLPDRTTLVFNS